MTKQNHKDSLQFITRRQKVHPLKIKLSKDLRLAMTPAEKMLWQHLRAGKLNSHRFRRQQIIDGFIVDFYCHKSKLVIEIDGAIHENQKDKDNAREDALSHRGLQIIRFTNREIIEDLDKVLSRIEKTCSSKS